MAYTTATMTLIAQGINSPSLWIYTTTDAHGDVDAADYFSNGDALGMTVNDVVIVVDTDTNTTTIHSVDSVTAGGAASITAATLS